MLSINNYWDFLKCHANNVTLHYFPVLICIFLRVLHYKSILYYRFLMGSDYFNKAMELESVLEILNVFSFICTIWSFVLLLQPASCMRIRTPQGSMVELPCYSSESDIPGAKITWTFNGAVIISDFQYHWNIHYLTLINYLLYVLSVGVCVCNYRTKH